MNEKLKSTAEILWQDEKDLAKVVWIGLKRVIGRRSYPADIVPGEVEFDTPLETQPWDYAVEPEISQAA